jgi:hypothetical protein
MIRVPDGKYETACRVIHEQEKQLLTGNTVVNKA